MEEQEYTMTVQERYNDLRNEFINIARPLIDSDVIKEIKNNYACEIGSNRKLSDINDLESLIGILEKRAILFYNNLEILYYIEKNFIKSSYLQSKLKIYEQWLDTLNIPQNCNLYLFDNSENTQCQKTCDKLETINLSSEERSMLNLQTNCIEGSSARTCLSDKEMNLKHKVLLYISERLGRSWRHVVRGMDIREYQIEEIETKYPFDLKEQSYQALQICISQQNSMEWKLKLLHGLEKGRRKDIKEAVEKLIIYE